MDTAANTPSRVRRVAAALIMAAAAAAVSPDIAGSSCCAYCLGGYSRCCDTGASGFGNCVCGAMDAIGCETTCDEMTFRSYC